MAFVAAAAPLLGAVGAGVSAIGSIAAGNANAAAANYQAQVARNNQLVANQNAAYAAQSGNVNVYNEGLRQRARAGEITTQLAGSGLDVNTGSAARVRESQAELGLQSEQQTAANAALTAYGYRTQAASFGAQAQLSAAEAPRDITAGYLGAAGGILSSAGNIGFKWSGFQNAGNSSSAFSNPYGGYAAWAMGGAT